MGVNQYIDRAIYCKINILLIFSNILPKNLELFENKAFFILLKYIAWILQYWYCSNKNQYWYWYWQYQYIADQYIILYPWSQCWSIKPRIYFLSKSLQLLIIIRLWSHLMSSCSPQFTKKDSTLDVLAELFRLLTSLWVSSTQEQARGWRSQEFKPLDWET